MVLILREFYSFVAEVKTKSFSDVGEYKKGKNVRTKKVNARKLMVSVIKDIPMIQNVAMRSGDRNTYSFRSVKPYSIS
ncbi:MAG: hypothetical protein QQW96_18420 [Tychonema bourrellyi B0820]|uniref:Uncharacterized protein n=2 Tax=Tychonema bourrellyi TaxID=54313 RepID=A0A2G4EXA1_9CYAN|nr:hypothetical protein [Tychonema bourrellyi B0820]PHX54108.1 hypothetical protein CP500_017870 [Tychonema bourrellyi FEM_GT703]